MLRMFTLFYRLSVFALHASLTCAAAVRFTPASQSMETQEFVEVTAESEGTQANAFTSFFLRGTLQTPADEKLAIDGFCDAPDGSIHRIRFLAKQPGVYNYSLVFDNGKEQSTYAGSFTARASKRTGLLALDPEHPFHFVWSGTGEHYFWNGLTTYGLLGWRDERYIAQIIGRAADYSINRLRVSLIGPRVADASRWYEPVKPSDRFRFLFGPWPAADPDNIAQPRWDVSRFDLSFFQKVERTVKEARAKDVIISVIFFLDGADAGADPFGKAGMFGPDIYRYYRYVNARLGSYSNVTWDLTNEWHLFRNAWWVEQMGTYLKSIDPYKHLVSTHGKGDFPWAVSQWPDFALYQLWDEEGGYDAMLKRRQAQLATGHPLPQINEEYGYEDHYPVKWGGNRRPPARNADSRRRLAWEITMAGCYQTTGEKANRNGDGQAPATPGGWTNGGFDDSMHLLDGYRGLAKFFQSIPYWKLEPVLPTQGSKPAQARVLAEPGVRYVVYVPDGSQQTVQLGAGSYRCRKYGPTDMKWADLADAQGESWTTPLSESQADVAYLLERR